VPKQANTPTPNISEHRLTKQHPLLSGREGSASYTQYWTAMDAVSRQKSALTTTHVPPKGAVIVDFGSGTGATAYDIAKLYPLNKVIGVDVDPLAVRHAMESRASPNLSFQQVDGTVLDGSVLDGTVLDGSVLDGSVLDGTVLDGTVLDGSVLDGSALPFPAGSITVFHNSSVLHEVASYAPKPFDRDAIRRVLDQQTQMLCAGGLLIIRDFVAPVGPEQIIMDLRRDNGATSGLPKELSTAALFQRFAREFRGASFPTGGLGKVEELGTVDGIWQRYSVPLRLAAEFILRKDYQARWQEELPEEYLYFSQAEFEAEFAARGLRVVVAQEIHNPWIVANRFEGQVRLFDLLGTPLPHIPTNFFIVGEKVSSAEGVRLGEASSVSIDNPSYLSLRAFEMVDSQQPERKVTYEVVGRPLDTIDVLPWFEQNGEISILAKQGYPRPIVNVPSATDLLDHSSSAGYLVEIINAVRITSEATIDETVARALRDRTQAKPLESAAGKIQDRYTFFSSPGGVDEQIQLRLCAVSPVEDVGIPHQKYSSFSTSGAVRPLDVNQLLRSYQVGGMLDARLEVGAYLLLRALGRTPQEWIEVKPKLTRQTVVEDLCRSVVIDDASHKQFSEIQLLKFNYLDLRRGQFVESAADGSELSIAELEYVVPKTVSNNTCSVLPIILTDQGPVVGLELRHLPVPQVRTGSSAILTVPAFRLPKYVTDARAARLNVTNRLAQEFGIYVKQIIPLGGKTYLSPGVIPEVVYPHLVEVEAHSVGKVPTGTELRWIPLRVVMETLEQIHDLQTLQLLLRTAHTLKVPLSNSP